MRKETYCLLPTRTLSVPDDPHGELFPQSNKSAKRVKRRP